MIAYDDNINFTRRTLNVKIALKRKFEFDEDWNVVSRDAVVGTTKTKKSVRSIKMSSVVIAILQEWKQYCEDNGIHSPFVFPNTKNGKMRTYSGIRSLLRRFIAKYRLEEEDITLYTLRHTFATILLEHHENPKIVMELMGHTKVKTTLDMYSHIVDDTVYDKTVQTLDGAYASITRNEEPKVIAL